MEEVWVGLERTSPSPVRYSVPVKTPREKEGTETGVIFVDGTPRGLGRNIRRVPANFR